MLTLISSLLAFLSGGLPSILGCLQERSDKNHEMDMAKLQTERELQLAEKGFVAQAKIEEIKLDQIEVETQLQIAFELQMINPETYNSAIELAQEIGRMIYALKSKLTT